MGYDRLLAEVLSSEFQRADSSEMERQVRFPIDSSAFRHLARYVGRVKLLSNLHMLYRRVGKGSVLDASSSLLVAKTSELIEHAIQIYDTRHDRSHEFLGAGLGMYSVEPDIQQLVNKSSGGDPTAFFTFGCTPSFPAPVTYPDGTGGLCIATVQIRHVPKMLNLERILAPIGEEGGLPDYLPSIAALCELLMLVPMICLHVPWGLSSIVQHGYVFVGDIVNRYLPEVIDQLASWTPGFAWPADYSQLCEALFALNASVWPLSSGNVLRRFRTNFLIDITGASHALLHRVELTRSPLIGNLRARAFELQCQDLINGTAWEHPQELKVLRGRPLRQAGRVLTDIDAFGVKDRTLLIVSCKSIIYDRNYDQGIFNVIRNTQATIDSAVVAWKSIVAELTQNPTGENFDFSGYDEIIGVVCTPFAAYSSNELTLAFIKPNLRVCSSILELRDWLAAYTSTNSVTDRVDS